MKHRILLALAASLTLVAACGRLNSPEKKSGYAVGMSIGQSLKSVADKIEVGEVAKGLTDELGGQASMSMEEMQGLLMGLSQGQAGDKAKVGYAVGVSIGKNVGGIKGLIDAAQLQQGMRDQLAGKPKLDEAGMREALNELNMRQQAAQQALRETQGPKNREEGAKYLAANKAKAGVKVTASGLQYEVLKPGQGPKPKPTDTVRVHYVGTLIDGTKFDSSLDRGQPAEFPLNQVIRGWTEGVALMPVGSKFKFTIPGDLAYGPNGQGDKIGPDAVLIFEVELLKIVK